MRTQLLKWQGLLFVLKAALWHDVERVMGEDE